jgi:hypothetical protein
VIVKRIMHEFELIADTLFKGIVIVSALTGLVSFGVALARASGWASRMESKLTDGFRRNDSDHGVLKDLLDEHTKNLASHAEMLVEHRIRIKGLEHQISQTRMHADDVSEG